MLFNCLSHDDETWVPEFDWPDHYYNDLNARVNQQQLFSAGAGAKWGLCISMDNVLHLKGVRVDVLAYVKHFLFEPTDAYKIYAMITEWSRCLWTRRPGASDTDAAHVMVVQDYVRRNKCPNRSTLSDAIC